MDEVADEVWLNLVTDPSIGLASEILALWEKEGF